MAYTNPRGLSLTDQGQTVVTLCQFTQADYSAAGTSDPAAGDIVTFSTTGNYYVALAADNTTARFGRVVKVEKSGASAAVGTVVVEWLDVERFVAVDCDDMSTMTLGNSAIKDGNTTVVNNFDALAATGPLVVWAKSSTAAVAGTALCAVCVA
jgi:hypothetical protein